MTKQKVIEYQIIDNNIALVKINKPEVLNALDKEVAAELNTALDIASNNKKIKVIIITGHGERSFCAGGDLNYVSKIDTIEAERYSTYMHNLLNKIENLEKPVIAAVNGFALGGGCQLALACDIRIASSNAKMGQPEVSLGIPPGWGGTQRLPRIVGLAKAKELIFTGNIITAEEAEKIGLVNRIVGLTKEEEEEENTTTQTSATTAIVKSSDDSKKFLNSEQIQKQGKQKINDLSKVLNKKLIDECIFFAKEITKNSFTAVKTSKVLINKGIDVDIDTGLCLEIYGSAWCFAHRDKEKMMSSFLNKEKRNDK